MEISIELANDVDPQARIKVVGVGGGGGNAINNMIASGLEGVEFICANTDIQALRSSLASYKIQLGSSVTRGLGAGANPDVGRKAALEEVQRIAEALHGTDMVFITAGMGGGTGTGAAPIISQIARDQKALTVAVVTKPFAFEGKRRARNAEAGIEELSEAVDTVITIPNDKLLAIADDDMSMVEAFRRADDVLLQAVRGISDLIVTTGMINVDFADVKTIMSSTGRALMGTGFGRGERRAREAAETAINSPLLEDLSIQGATGVLINFTASADIKLKEINDAASLVREACDEEANIIFGVVTDPAMSDMVKVTVIATGFDKRKQAADERLSRSTQAPAQTSIPVGVRPPTHAPFGLGVRSETQQPGARTRLEQRHVIARPAPRGSEAPEQVTIADIRGARAYGPAAMHDEDLLEIPTFIRRNGARQQASE